MPRIGAFEVSINGVLIYSKCLSGSWPNYKALSERLQEVALALDQGEDISSFQTKGMPEK